MTRPDLKGMKYFAGPRLNNSRGFFGALIKKVITCGLSYLKAAMAKIETTIVFRLQLIVGQHTLSGI
jgi:hypothetical protein